MVEDAEAILALKSVTFTLIVKVPLALYMCEAVLPTTFEVPSPKFQLNVYGVVPPVAVAETLTAVPTVPVVGMVGVIANASGLIVMAEDADAIFALKSVTLTLIVKVPLTA